MAGDGSGSSVDCSLKRIIRHTSYRTTRKSVNQSLLSRSRVRASAQIHRATLTACSATFSCPIVHSLPYCPSIAYAVPLSPPQFPNIAHSANTLPSAVVSPLLEVLSNFTTSLLTFACGRDEYSPLVSCADCQEAYRKWLCTIWFSRCSEAVDTPTSTDSDVQKPVSALAPQAPSATPRSPGLQPFADGYTALLPCLETCTAVDRACPNFVGFTCPVPRFNAASSYGLGFIDSGEEGVQGHGLTGVAQDQWGNVWCNAG